MPEKTTVPALAQRVSEQQAAEMPFAENLPREDLRPLEHAGAFAGVIQKAADDVVKKRMRFDQIEEMVMQMQGMLDPLPGMPGYVKKKSGARWMDPNVRSAQGELERLLGVRVRIKDRKGKGKIVIEYHTVDDYERVVGMLKSSG